MTTAGALIHTAYILLMKLKVRSVIFELTSRYAGFNKTNKDLGDAMRYGGVDLQETSLLIYLSIIL